MIPAPSRTLMFFVSAALFFSLAGTALSIVPPRRSGVTLPVPRSALEAQGVGMPAPVPGRFLVTDGEGNRTVRIEGVYPVPVLLGEYSNTTGTYSSAEFQTMLFDGPFPTGTMKEYYEENSYGLFTLEGTVFGWYGMPGSSGYYEGGDNGFGTDFPTNAGGFVYDLAAASDPDVDYGLYDNDGPDGMPNSGDDDGVVDAFFAVHTGNGGECGGTGIWSHRWRVSSAGGPPGGYETDDPAAGGGFIHVNDYIIMPELDCSANEMNAIGVFCHEFGHSLGLPDLYDGDGSSEGIGGWGLMGSGSWGGDQAHPELPVHFTPWSKERLGWIEPFELGQNTDVVSLPRVEDSPTVVRVWKDGDYTGTEYFLVENRQKVGFDASLIRPGILIWHVDNDRPHNNDETHKLVDLEEADGTNGLDNSGNRGDAGDPWPGSTGNRRFDWDSRPDSYSYYGYRTEVSVVDIGDPDSLMTVRFTVRSAVIDSISWNTDDPGGDGDGVWDIGETLAVDFTVENDSQTPAESLWAVLESDDPMVTVDTDSVFLGTLEGSSWIGNGGEPFLVTALPESEVHRTTLRLTLSGNEFFSWSSSMDIMIGHPSVLLVDDSEEGSGILDYYAASLDSLSVPFISRTVSLEGSAADTLEPFDLVIWFSGRETEDILDSLDLLALEGHLERGGRLLLSGQNIAEDLAAREDPFLGEILGVAGWGGTATLPFAYGIDGDPVTGEIEVIVSAGPKGANNQTSKDILEPVFEDLVMASYDSTDPGQAAATRNEFPEYGAKVIFLGFGFEAVNRPSGDPLHTTRLEFMEKMLAWLETPVGVEDAGESGGHVPRIVSLGQNYPNPFNPSTTISFEIPAADRETRTRLVIYNIRGTRVRSLVDRILSPGLHRVVWDGRDDRGTAVSSGIYFCRIAHGETSITRKMLLLE